MKTTIEITIENSEGETLVLTYEEGRQLYDSLKNFYSKESALNPYTPIWKPLVTYRVKTDDKTL